MKNREPLQKRVVAIIQEKRITPHTKTHFIIKNVLFWVGSVLFLIGGSLAMSVIIFRFSNIGILTSAFPMFKGLTLITTLIPLTWFILFGIFLYVSYREIRHTKKGYKMNILLLGIVILVISMIGGGVMYTYGGGYILDTMSSSFIPFHRSIESIDKGRWFRPHAGYLVGVVTKIDNDSISVMDPSGTFWEVLPHEEVILDHSITVGDRIRVKGTEHATSSFFAEEIIPWEIRGRGMFERNSTLMRSNR